MNLELKILQPDDFGDLKTLIHIFEEVFGMQVIS